MAFNEPKRNFSKKKRNFEKMSLCFVTAHFTQVMKTFNLIFFKCKL